MKRIIRNLRQTKLLESQKKLPFFQTEEDDSSQVNASIVCPALLQVQCKMDPSKHKGLGLNGNTTYLRTSGSIATFPKRVERRPTNQGELPARSLLALLHLRGDEDKARGGNETKQQQQQQQEEEEGEEEEGGTGGELAVEIQTEGDAGSVASAVCVAI